MLKHRLLYGGTLLTLFLGIVSLDFRSGGATGTSILIAVFSLTALFEYYDITRRVNRPSMPLLGLGAAALLLGVKLSGLVAVPAAALLAVVMTGLVFAVTLASRGSFEERLECVLLTVFGFSYVTVPTSFFLDVLALPGPPTGLRLFLWSILVVKFTDTAAYFVGTKFGRTKLSSLSPNKSWEGAVGGTVAAVALAGALAGPALAVDGSRLVEFLLLATVLSVVGQAGDLVESAVKRGFGVKDSGRWLPGIGGILDSIDSLIPIGPFLIAVAALS